jgi:hypothetical protein
VLVVTEIETAMRLVTLVLLFREGQISRKEFERAANISPEMHVVFQANIDKRMREEAAKIRSEGN